MRAELASKRSALAKLGSDPDKTVLDFTPRPRGGAVGVTIPKTGQTYVRADSFDEGADPLSTIVHENIHRGTHKLMESPYWDPAWNDLGIPLPKGMSERHPEGNRGPFNEYVVRWLMQNRMGDPEGAPSGTTALAQKQNANALFLDKHMRQNLDAMEAAASRMLKDKNPRGPR